MRIRHIAVFSAAVLAGALAGSLLGPRPAQAVARELIELQRDVTSLLQGQKDLTTQMTQDHTGMRTIVDQTNSSLGTIEGTIGSLQKSLQDVQTNPGAGINTISTQIQALPDILEETKPRPGKPTHKLVAPQNPARALDPKIPAFSPAPAAGTANPAPSA